MDDLEARLRATVTSRQQEFTPSEDMEGRIKTRVQRRHRRRQQLAGAGLVTGVLLVAAASLTLGTADEGGSVRMGDGDGERVRTAESTRPTTSTTTKPSEEASAPPQSTTSSTPTTSSVPPTSSTTEAPVPDPVLWRFTPLTRRGIGPVQVGMTVAEAEVATGVTFTLGGPYGPNYKCAMALLDGQDISFELEFPGGDPGVDVRATGVIRTAMGNQTQEGVFIGSSVADLDRIYGPPTRTLPYYFGGDEVRIYESDGYAYAATIAQGVVRYLTSGDAAWQDTPEQCQLNPGDP